MYLSGSFITLDKLYMLPRDYFDVIREGKPTSALCVEDCDALTIIYLAMQDYLVNTLDNTFQLLSEPLKDIEFVGKYPGEFMRRYMEKITPLMANQSMPLNAFHDMSFEEQLKDISARKQQFRTIQDTVFDIHHLIETVDTWKDTPRGGGELQDTTELTPELKYLLGKMKGTVSRICFDGTRMLSMLSNIVKFFQEQKMTLLDTEDYLELANELSQFWADDYSYVVEDAQLLRNASEANPRWVSIFGHGDVVALVWEDYRRHVADAVSDHERKYLR